MARYPFSHRFLIYLALIAMELLRVWYVIAGARANGNGLMNIVGGGWGTWRDGARDSLLAIGTIVLVAATARMLVFCSAVFRQTLDLCCRQTSLNRQAGSCSQLPAASVRKSRIAAICNGNSGLSLARSPLPSAYKPSLSGGAAPLPGEGGKFIVVVGRGLVFVFARGRRSIIPGTIAHSILDILGGLFGG